MDEYSRFIDWLTSMKGVHARRSEDMVELYIEANAPRVTISREAYSNGIRLRAKIDPVASREALWGELWIHLVDGLTGYPTSPFIALRDDGRSFRPPDYVEPAVTIRPRLTVKQVPPASTSQ